MKKNVFIFLGFILFYQQSFSQNKEHILFNGNNLSGWQKVGDNATFEVKENCIELHQKANTTEHTYLRTVKKYKNFVLEMDCKRDTQFYYGILFRAIDAPDTAHVRLYGYQVKVDHDKIRKWTGAIFDDFGNTWKWLTTLQEDKNAQNALKNAGEWDNYRVEAIGNTFKVWLNGVQTSNLINDKYAEGYIALKIHFLGNRPENEKYSAQIKNIKIIAND
jgi:hypothetical protein